MHSLSLSSFLDKSFSFLIKMLSLLIQVTELELGQFYDLNSELTIFVTTFVRVFEYSLTKTQKTDFDTHGFWMDRVNFKLSLILNFFLRLIQSMLCMIFEN